MELAPCNPSELTHWFKDFAGKAGAWEVPDGSYCVKVTEAFEPIGYFILWQFDDATVDIIQGYLKTEARHKRNDILAMKLLEFTLKKYGIRRLRLRTARSLRAYKKFMDTLKYKPSEIVFEKVI